MRKVSRSYREERGRCARRAYYRYLYNGKGYDGAGGKLDLKIGLAVHRGMEVLLKTSDIDQAVNEAGLEAIVQLKGDVSTHEGQSALHLSQGLVMGWIRARWEDFQARYEVLSVEEEIPPVVLAPSILMPIRIDAVVRERETGLVYVINWKTSREVKEWTGKWSEEVQAWTEAMGWEDHSGRRVDGVLFEGLYKGPFRDGVHVSALIYGYKKKMPSGDVVYSPKWASGWTRFNVWEEFEGGLPAWISWLPKAQLEAMFPTSPPIMKDNEVVRDWLEQWVRWETDAQHTLDNGSVRDQELYFGQEFSNFNCKWCPFKPVCFKKATIQDLIEMGKLEPREDHHPSPVEEVLG